MAIAPLTPKSVEEARRIKRRLIVIGASTFLGLAIVAQFLKPRALNTQQQPAGPAPSSTTAPATTQPDSDTSAPDPVVLRTLSERYMAAYSSKDRSQLQAVIRDAQELADKYPRHAPLHTLLGQAFLQSDQFKPAYEQLARSLELDKQQPEVQLLAGTVAMQLGETEQAARHYSMATGLSPREPRYMVHLALAYLKLGQTDRARDTFLAAIRVDSSCHAAFKGLADLYAQQNKLDLALGQIQNAIDQTPLSQRDVQVVYLRQKASLLRRANRATEALAVFDALTPTERAEPAVVQDVATTWGQLGEPRKSAEAFESALDAKPLEPALLVEAARWRIKVGDHAKALEHVASLRSVSPRHPALAELDAALTPKVAR
jgi:tetratricopeptide (TPR) repeat protein